MELWKMALQGLPLSKDRLSHLRLQVRFSVTTFSVLLEPQYSAHVIDVKRAGQYCASSHELKSLINDFILDVVLLVRFLQGTSFLVP